MEIFVKIPDIIPENLKLLHELRILKDLEPSKSFTLVPAFMQLFVNYHKKTGSMIAGLDLAIKSYCSDLSPNESAQVKGSLVTLLTQFDPIFCREWLVERCLQGATFTELKEYCEYVISRNMRIGENQPKN